MANKSVSKTIHAVEHIDTFEDGENLEVSRFFTLEGCCKRCDAGDNTLVIYDFRANKRDPGQNIIRTFCLVCFSKTIHYAKNIS